MKTKELREAIEFLNNFDSYSEYQKNLTIVLDALDSIDNRCCANCGRHDGWNGCGEYVENCMQDYDAYSNWVPKDN